MGESITEPDTNPVEKPSDIMLENKELTEVETQPETISPSGEQVIWTPTFIVLFAFTLVFGLSAESLLTQGWLVLDYPGGAILLTHIALICICLVAAAGLTRSWWVRSGGLFGCIWAACASTDIVLNFQRLPPTMPLLAHLNVATCLALLGSAICFSMSRTPFRRWDGWLFGLAFGCGSMAVAIAYFLTDDRSLVTLEMYVAAAELFLSIAVWWLRPSCWQNQPGPTLLFGLSVLLLLAIAIPNFLLHEPDFFLAQLVSFPIHHYGANNETHFFLAQVSLLCLLLAAMRILKCEIRN